MLFPKSVRRNGLSAGFTLIELVIVIVIVSILAAVALPGFQDAMRKGRRADAREGLMDAANRQERFMLDRSTYTTDLTQLGYADPMITEEGHYGIVAAACDGDVISNCYKLTAAPRSSSPQVKDTKCGSFILDSTGEKTVTGHLPAEDCW